jgi:hypothetical protein
MKKRSKIEVGGKVRDLVHKTEGTVVAIVEGDKKENRNSYLVVKLDDGRIVHLDKGKYA